MSCLLVLLCCAGTLAAAWPQPSKVYYDIADAERHFSEFINTFDKQYAHDDERDSRFQIFKKNLEIINKKNKEQELTVFGITIFADLTTEEFLEKHTGYNNTGDSNCQIRTLSEEPRASASAPESLDWREQGKVTKVKNQLQCGSCWAFSTAGNVEGQYAIKHNQLVEFSEQQQVDCIKKSCDGYSMSASIETMRQQNGGLMLESAYPYTGTPGTCNYNPSSVVAKITGCQAYALQSEEELKQVVASVGPLAIGVAAADFQNYHGGIFDKCGGKINHGVLLVGYGTEGGVPYWIIKNSYGAKFGEQGYIRIQRGVNMCNIMDGEHVTAEIA